MKLVPEAVPFLIPPALRELLTAKVLEYGTGGDVYEHLPGNPVWSILLEDDSVGGYAWFAEHRGPHSPEGYHLNIAVLPPAQGAGVGTFALSALESHARSVGISELFCQVNSNAPSGSYRVRRWLLRSGYSPLRDRDGRYSSCAKLSDDEYIRDNPLPVYFRKSLVGA